ncbi:MAG: hypothetical protein LBQ36_09080 [Synergistaceae bacterium]|nr:hypothetical protein [Synergistaceae bacterium]
MIESFVEGRIRLRSPLFSDPEIAELVKEGLLKIDGVVRAEANPRTSGLLLEYDKERLPLSRLTCAAPLIADIGALESLPAAERPAAARRLMEDLRAALE